MQKKEQGAPQAAVLLAPVKEATEVALTAHWPSAALVSLIISE